MIDRLRERVARHTIPAGPAECWGWDASALPNARPRLGVRINGRSTSITAARIIAAAEHGLPLTGGAKWVARHTCDNHACVNPAHIIPGTYRQNTVDMWNRGRGARGDRRPSAKLSAEKVRQIRRQSALGDSQSTIAARFGVSQSLIAQVKQGKVWSWVE